MKYLWFIGAVFIAASASAQSVTVFGNSDAQQCYFETKLLGGGSALEYCNNALKFGALNRVDRASTYVNRGINYTRAGMHDEALADYEDALQLIPDLGEAFLNRGNTYVMTQRFNEGLTDYNRAIELGTRKPQAAYYNRGLAYEALRNLDAAYKDFTKAAELAPGWGLPLERIQRYDERYYKTAR